MGGLRVMFICEECAKNYEITQMSYHCGIKSSFGPCEDCGKTTACYDIAPRHYKRKNNT